MSVIIFIIILAILILVHEFGHFIVAKKSGVRVDEFGLGFPPKIFSKKFGETLYTLNAIPFGGFVKIFGEDPHGEEIKEEDKKTSFFYKPKWVQALILVAGVTFNLIFAWLLISSSFVMGVSVPTDYSGLGEVKNVNLTITDVLKDSPANKSGLQSGDKLISLSSGKVVLEGSELNPENTKKIISESKNEIIELSYKRGDDLPKTISIKPSLDAESGENFIGIVMENIGTLKLSPHLALLEGAKTTYLFTKNTAIGLGDFFWKIITLKSDFSGVSGPVGIATIVGEANSLGFVYLLSLVAIISINLAVINLVPFPALDGGRLLFILIEVIIRRPISPKFVIGANAVGFVLLIILMIFVTGHDIVRLF